MYKSREDDELVIDYMKLRGRGRGGGGGEAVSQIPDQISENPRKTHLNLFCNNFVSS